MVFKVFRLLIQSALINKVVFYTAVVAGCVIAFSPAEAGLQPQLNDKFLHIVGFFVMAVMSHLAHPKSNQYVLGLGLMLFGLAIELVQAYLPYRTFSLWDWCADISGIAAYFLFISPFVTYKLLPD